MDLSTSAGHFSDELTKQLITDSHTGNALVSPVSLLTALSMLLAGTRGSTRTSLSSALQLPSNVSQETIDSAHHTLISAYKAQSNDANKLVIKNNVLVAQNYVKDSPLLPSYETTVREKYDATIEGVDFVNNGVAVKNKVNAWVNDSTQGLIKSLLDGPPAPETVFMLLNAVFFDCKWAKKFKSPYPREFFLEGGANKTTTFMSQENRFKYLEIDLGSSNEKVQAVEVPYQSNASMIILLPPESTSVNALFDQKLVYSMSRRLVSAGNKRLIKLHMPKFKFDTKQNMNQILTSMGAGNLFLTPDLSGINGASNIKVSNVRHATAIEVDEEGTKAAAVTGIEIALTSLVTRSEEPLYVILDRPFAFVIYDTDNHVPLFVGKLGDPVSP